MGKLLLLLSLAVLVTVGLGVHLIPNSQLFWLASNSTGYQHIRILVGALLMIQLATNPPRQVWFRIVASAVALATGYWAVQQAMVYSMQLLDVLAFLAASFAIFATALERDAQERAIRRYATKL